MFTIKLALNLIYIPKLVMTFKLSKVEHIHVHTDWKEYDYNAVKKAKDSPYLNKQKHQPDTFYWISWVLNMKS